MNTLAHDTATDSANPYTPPKNSPTAFAKRRLTATVCTGLVAASILLAVWLYTQTTNSVYERNVDTKYSGPYMQRAAPVD